MPRRSPPQSGSLTVAVRDRAALLAATPAPTCEVALTDVTCDYAAGQVTRVVASGLCWGANAVDVTLDGGGLIDTRGANVGTAGAWSASFNLASSPMPLGTSVHVHVAAAGPGSCDAASTDALILATTGADVVGEMAACEAGYEAARNHFVAGYADRLVRSRFFMPIACSFFETPTVSKTHLARAMTRTGITRKQAYARAEDFAGALRERGRELLGEMTPQRAAAPRLGTSLRKAVSDAAKVLRGEVRQSARTKAGARAARALAAEEAPLTEVAFTTGLRVAAYGPRPSGQETNPRPVFGGAEAVVGTTRGMSVAIVDGVEQYVAAGWLGILYYDRLRFRPSGLVAGDHVYSLSLAPGEEVTLTQRSETKRSRAFEEILDRTTEQELEFSSTWSTDVSQEDAASATSTVGGNLGVSASIPIDVVEIGVNAGVNASQSNTVSSTRQRSRTNQVTTRIAARAREQHKTTFKVSTDLTEEFGSKRVLRNPNPSRALTLNFHKLYAKHRVVLERYDAKLSLAICLPDPGRLLRDEIEEEFAKLDPQVPPGACPNIPQGASVSSEKLIENENADEWGGDEWGFEQFSTVLPTNTVLSDWKFEITEWIIEEGDGSRRTADPAVFEQHGGQWWFERAEDSPTIGAGGAMAHWIRVLMPEAWGPGWWTVSVKGRFTWSYVASDAINEQARACIEAEKKKIRDSFSAERVMQIFEEVNAGERQLVFQRVFESVLLKEYFQLGTNPPCALLERLRNSFEWNEAVVEYLPWWMTPGGRERRDRLRQQLLALPGDTRSDLIIDDRLVASAARIYLPIRPGMEEEILAQLLGRPSLAGTALEGCVDDFITWREQNLGEITYPLPGFDSVMGIGPALATPAGADDWEHDWERPRRRFLVLDEWSESLPTDGVHVEPALSTCGSADEFRASALRSDLETAAGRREVDEARAALERQLAGTPAPSTTIVIGDPAYRP